MSLGATLGAPRTSDAHITDGHNAAQGNYGWIMPMEPIRHPKATVTKSTWQE